MKRHSVIILISTLVILTLLLSSCSISGLAGGLLDADGEDDGKYMTREEVEELIAGIEKNVTVNAGDNIDIEITSEHEKNLLAASKGLLSAVSVNASFDITYSSGYPFYGTTTTTQTSAGAGVIYSLDKTRGDAYIITNYHVIYHSSATANGGISSDIAVYLYGLEYLDYKIPATFVGGSESYDIAVLRVSDSEVLRASEARAVSFADSNAVVPLQTAITIGNPTAGGISATVGCVSVDSEYIDLDGNGTNEFRVIRIDAAVNKGTSGGGLYDDEGNLIGIVNARNASSSVDNIGYAIPSNIAKFVSENIIYYDTQSSENNAARRLSVGVEISISGASVDYDTETGKVVKVESVFVKALTAGGIAEASGVQVNDIVKSITVDGKTYEVTRSFALTEAALNIRQTSTVVLNVIRGGEAKAITLNVTGGVLTDIN